MDIGGLYSSSPLWYQSLLDYFLADDLWHLFVQRWQTLTPVKIQAKLYAYDNVY